MKKNLQEYLTIIHDKVDTWIADFIAILPNLALAVVIVLGAWLAARLARNLSSRLLRKVSNNESLNYIGNTLVYIAVLSVGIFSALTVLHLDKAVTSMLAGVGIVGLALGFAFQDIAANFVSGVLISIRKPYTIGDLIDTNGKMGIVESINLRTTMIQDFQGQEVIIPNKDIFGSVLMNYTTYPKRRVDLSIGVSYGETLTQVRDIAIKAIHGLDMVDRDEEITLFYSSFGDSSINFDLRFWVNEVHQPKYLVARSEAIIAIKRAFDREGISIPFPIRTLDFGIKGGKNLETMLGHETQHQN
jgi:small conductance mechanosensitive channel